MRKRGSGETSLINCFARGVYKVIGFWFGELKARLIGVRNESQNGVVYNGDREGGVVR